MSDPITIIESTLGVDTATAEEILLVTHWVDQEVARRRFGYPKDNLIPPAMEERLADADYVALLLEELEADEEASPAAVEAVRQSLATLRR